MREGYRVNAKRPAERPRFRRISWLVQQTGLSAFPIRQDIKRGLLKAVVYRSSPSARGILLIPSDEADRWLSERFEEVRHVG